MTKFAIQYHPDAYSLRGKVMGRQSAGTAFLRAIAQDRPDNLWCYAPSRADAEDCAQALSTYGTRTGVVWLPFSQPQRLAEPGLLFRPDPVLDKEAWRRLSQSNPRAYSLCGITHTIASEGPMSVLAALATAPLEPWDAIICTSRAVRDSVRTLVESQVEYLRERTGATRFTLPQLPLIPLGVHCADYDDGPTRRAGARAGLGITQDEIVVIFVGRLSFHGKAHPAPLYLALEACAKDHKVTLIQAGWFANEAIGRAFQEDAKALCPSVRMLHIDARDQSRLRDLWAAADIFTSLSDNIQETFGLTPLEAMAAGLPIVVSDWDGYKDTVRDGIDGFRISTLTLPAGFGNELADRFEAEIDDYDRYCGYTSQLVAVNVSETEAALRRLMESPALRQQMGNAGRQRARSEFDWSCIFKRYLSLWEELSERRRSDADVKPPLSPRRRPDRPDPFSLFSSYPSYAIGPACEFRRCLEVDLQDALARRDLSTVSFAKPILPPDNLIRHTLEILHDDIWRSFSEISERNSDVGSRNIARTLIWLAKMGVIDFRRTP